MTTGSYTVTVSNPGAPTTASVTVTPDNVAPLVYMLPAAMPVVSDKLGRASTYNSINLAGQGQIAYVAPGASVNFNRLLGLRHIRAAEVARAVLPSTTWEYRMCLPFATVSLQTAVERSIPVLQRLRRRVFTTSTRRLPGGIIATSLERPHFQWGRNIPIHRWQC